MANAAGQEQPDEIGIAVSGGGHRAALFALGALLYFADSGLNARVSAISSVSGGSLTNAHIGLRGNFREIDRDGFRAHAARFASQVANRGTFFAWAGTKLYLALWVLTLAAAGFIWLLDWHWAARLVAFLAALVVSTTVVFAQRGRICGQAYAATLFDGSRGIAEIAHEGIDHVICATHLDAGEHLYLSGRFAYAARFGWGEPDGLRLHAATQGSTAFPGAFPARWHRRDRLGFDHAPRRIPVVDGGVYDNMAAQWMSGMRKRRDVPDHVQRPGSVVFVNSSASLAMKPTRRFRLPLLGELLTLAKDVSILYDNAASLRKSDLVDRFDAHELDPSSRIGLRGCLLDIRSDPFRGAEVFANEGDHWSDRRTRARAALAKKPDDWVSDAEWASDVKTSLSRFGVETSARLLRHGYALAAMNVHVFLDGPLVDIPPLADFEALCRD